jgi:RHS repeat-associated protein
VVHVVEETSGLDVAGSILSIKDSALISVPGTWALTGEKDLVFTPAETFSDAIYQVEIQLKDALGNEGAVSRTHFTLDRTAPPAPTVNPVTSPTHAITQLIVGGKEAYASILLDGQEVVGHSPEDTWQYLATLTNGSNTLSFTARDRAGNESDATQVEIILDDTAPPVVDTLSADPNGDGRSVHLSWAGYDESLQGDIASYRIYAQTSSFSSIAGLTAAGEVPAGTFAYTVANLTRGTTYWFAVVAVDQSGNFLTNVTPVQALPVDREAPENVTGLSVVSYENKLLLIWQPSVNSDGDLAGYRLYIDGVAEANGISAGATQFEKTGLQPATGYAFRLTCLDADGNESTGTSLTGVTLLQNPTGLAATPFSGYAALSWSPSAPAEYVKEYRIYRSYAAFSDVTGMSAIRTTDKTSLSITGLANDTTYYVAVTTVNISGGEQTAVTAIPVTPTEDKTGPALTGLTFDGAALVDGQRLENSGTVTATASDPAGVSHLEFYFDGALVRNDYSVPYSCYLDMVKAADGAHVFSITAFDSLGNSSSFTYNVTVGLAAPSAPVVTSPANGAIINKRTWTISGTSDKYTDVTLIHDGTETAAKETVGPLGTFAISYTLNEGENRLKAVAENRTGQSPPSSEVLVTVDTSIPDSPRSLTAQSKEGGRIKLLWQKPLGVNIAGYNIYRSSSEFDAMGQAQKVNAKPVTATGYTDLPATEGSWYYRVTSLNTAGTESALSDEVSAVSDATAPKAVSITYSPHGQYDPASGRIAPGRVDVVLQVSEPLGAVPFLTLTPEGGIPMSVELAKASDISYTGYFVVKDTTPGGTAYAVFSARDGAGNRGTEIGSGDRILLDTAGPAIGRLLISPTEPIKNSQAGPVTLTVTFGLTDAMNPGELPTLSLMVAADPNRTATVDGIRQIDTAAGDVETFEGTVTLPADAGYAAAETFQFVYQGRDDLDNTSTEILAKNEFQVYQGGLPPLSAPGNMKAKAISGGRVSLTWDAVDHAAAYELYRKGPGESAFSPLCTVEGAVDYTDQTGQDGLYTYAAASIRRENGDESVSGMSGQAQATADATCPQAPRNLTLDLVPQGIRCQWEAPPFTETISYAIYRSSETQITSVEGMAPLVTDIGQTMVVDPTPSPTDHCYVITARDKAGNESAPSNFFYLNFDLLPVSTITVVQSDFDPPVVSWSHSDTSGKIAGYYAYIGKDAGGTRVNQALMTDTAFTDYGFARDERSYTVVAVDTNDVHSMGRSITLPVVSATLTDDSRIERGIMNRIAYTVENHSAGDLTNLHMKARIGGKTHSSDKFSLAAGERKTIPVIVGGYDTLNDVESLTSTIEIAPNAGETVKINRTEDIDVGESAMVVGIQNEEFLRGGAGQVQFTFENTGAADVEIVTAENGNRNDSNDITWYLLDSDGNVLYAKSFRQSLGDGLVTLSNGKTVARIPAGEIFTSDPIDLFVPANAPDDLTVKIEIGKVYHDLGQGDQVTMKGAATRSRVTLIDTSYYGEVTNITPEVSKGDEDIVITGRAVDRASGAPLAGAPLNLVISVSGFERKYEVVTDETGAFTHRFTPLAGEAGVYTVRAVHPDLLDKPVQGRFVINRVSITPAIINLDIPKNYEQKIDIRVRAEKGTTLSNLRLEESGSLPAGVHLELPAAITSVSSEATAILTLKMWADNTAEETGGFTLRVKSDESDTDAWGSVVLNTHFSEARPALYFTPDHIETGVAREDLVTETVMLKNKGLAPLEQASLTLKGESGNPAPSWVMLNTPADIGDIAAGDTRDVSVSFAPDANVSEGLHSFYLTVSSANYPSTDIGLYVSVTQSGIGSALFKVSDIYTGTFNAKNELIRGVSGARIRIQNEEVLTIDRTLTTDSLGEALFEDLPAGHYKARITANNHQEQISRFWIKPGITSDINAFLEYNLVTVEWEVNEITLQDKYEVLLNTTYEADVPAAVVVAEPGSMALPEMEPGDVYNGEFTLTNYGLIRADGLSFGMPASSEYFKVELLKSLPASLEPKEKISIPYRVICLKSMSEESGSGGGCSDYWECIEVGSYYICANGVKFGGRSARHCIYSKNPCNSGGGGVGGTSLFMGGGLSGGSTTYVNTTGQRGQTSSDPGPKPTPIKNDEAKCLPRAESSECLNDKLEALKDKWQNIINKVGCTVNSVSREFNDEAVDLSVKVPGGAISIHRRFSRNQWFWDNLSRMRDGGWALTSSWYIRQVCYRCYSNSHGESHCDYYDCDEEGSTGHLAWVSKDEFAYGLEGGNVFKLGPYSITRKPDCASSGLSQSQCAEQGYTWDEFQDDKYRWEDKRGNWKTYDSMGRLRAYGNRYGVIGRLLYGQFSDMNPSGLADRNDRQVIWFDYNAEGQLSGVRDLANRQVRYDYTDKLLSRVSDVLQHETRYEYNAKGRLVRIVDAGGRESLARYNASGDVISVEDGEGNGQSFEYDYDKNKKEYYARIKSSSGRVKEVWYTEDGQFKKLHINGRMIQKIDRDGRDLIITDEKGNITRKDFDERDNLTRIVYPDGSEATFAYDLRFNRVNRVVDPLGRITALSYDELGNLTEKIEALGTAVERRTTYTYNDLGQVLSATIEAGQHGESATTAFTYDANGNLATIKDPKEGLTRFVDYDAMGNPHGLIDARGNEWRFEYDVMGRLTAQSDPLGNRTAYEYDGANNRTAVVNAFLKRFSFEYDEHNHMIKAIDPYKRYISIAYNTDQLPTRVTDQSGSVTKAVYDNEGRLTRGVDGAGNEVRYEYDETDLSPAASDRPAAIHYPSFTRRFTYDQRGRVTKETDELDPGTSHSRRFTYDAVGNVTSVTDEQDHTTRFEYDELNRLVRTTDPQKGTIERTYDNRGNVTSVKDANDGITYYQYDRDNRLTRLIRPLLQETAYEYDAVGNRTAVVDPKGQRIEYIYDSASRMRKVRYYTSSDHANPVKTVEFTYDKLGNLTGYEDGTTSASYTYDDLSRKTGETIDYGLFSLSYGYTYEANGLKKSFTGPDGTSIEYTYDENNRLTGIDLPGQGQLSYTYDAGHWNRPAKMQLPGGGSRAYGYDPLMRLKSLSARDPGANLLMSRGYTYSPAGNITAKETEHGSYSYQYDTLYRLTEAMNPTQSDESYTYDPNGNRLTDWRIPGTWQYNANNELQSVGDTGYSYDVNGNMIQKAVPGGTTTYTYDIEDRLTRVSNTGGMVADYYYDPFGRRLWKEVDGVRTYFLYSDEGMIGEYDAAGAEIKSYGYAPGSAWSSDPLFVKIAGSYYYYQNDHLGTPQMITQANGAVVWDAVYDAFGNCQISTETITSNLRLPGQYFDAETGLYYNWNRYYDPAIGRYLRADPYGDGLNLYAYVFGNPVNLIDPTGQCATHIVLAGLGMIPALGVVPDLLDTALYMLEQDWENAALSAVAAIPVVGLFSRGGQYIAKAVKYSDKILDVATKGKIAGRWIKEKIADAIQYGRRVLADKTGAIGDLSSASKSGGNFSRALKPGDLGVEGKLSQLKGTFSVKDGQAVARIDMIEGKITNPNSIIKNLTDTARSQGATSLRIEGTIANERLYNVLVKRYGMQTSGATDFITIPLGK